MENIILFVAIIVVLIFGGGLDDGFSDEDFRPKHPSEKGRK